MQVVLPSRLLDHSEIIAGAGRYSAQSLARSILATKQLPVALIVDADTTSKRAIKEQYDLLLANLGQASPGVQYKVLLAIPEIEILFVQDWDYIEKAGGTTVSSLQKELTQLYPKKILVEIFNNKPYKFVLRQLLDNMDDRIIQTIRKYPLIDELVMFLESVVNQNPEPSFHRGV